MGLDAQSVVTDIKSVTVVTAESSPSAGSVRSAEALLPTFEQLLQELEGLVTQLESGDLPLNEALHTFERGVRLTRDCQAALSSAQQKVQLLLQRGEHVVIEELDRGAIETGAAPGGAPDSTA
jgi:exodeoxyribonuclease VII small subunit